MPRIFITILIQLACCYAPLFSQLTPLQKQASPKQQIHDTQSLGLNGFWTGVNLDDGRMLFAGEGNSILIYDGWNWETKNVPNVDLIWSSLKDSSTRIWVGCSGDFGYLDLSETELEFHSLISGTKFKESYIEITYDIINHADSIFFIGQFSIYEYRDSEIFLHSFEESNSIKCFKVGTHLFCNAGTGLYKLQNNDFVRVANHTNPDHSNIHFGWKNNDNESIFLSSSNLYSLVDKSLVSLVNFSEDILDSITYTKAIQLSSGKIAVGSSNNGLFILDRSGDILESIVPKNYRDVANVNNVVEGNNNDIWLFSRQNLFHLEIDAGSRIVHYTLDYEYVQFWDSGSYGGEFAFANEDGIFQLNPDSESSFTQVFKNIVYGITPRKDGGLLVATPWDFAELLPDGDYNIILDGPISITSAYSKKNHAIWLGTRYDVRLLTLKDTEWVETQLITGFEGGATSLVEDPEGALWVSTNANQVLRYFTNSEKHEIIVPHSFPDFGIEFDEIGEVGMFKFQNKPWVLTEDRIFEWQQNNEFSPLYSSSSFAMESWNWKWIIPVHFAQNEDIWLIRKHRRLGGYQLGQLAELDNGTVKWQGKTIPDISYLGEIKKVHQFTDKKGISTLVITGANGIEFLNLKELKEFGSPSRPHLTLTTSPEAIGNEKHFKEGSDVNPSFTYFTPHYRKSELMFFQTRLRGLERAWTEPTIETHREFPGLRSGNYTFEVRTINGQGKYSTASAIGFRVLPPWYRTIPAFLVYGFFLINLGTLFFYARLRESKKREKVLEEKVQERTLELVKANRIKSDFVANMSHEIRNPMNGVIGGIRMLKPNKPVSDDLLKSLNHRSAYLSRLVNNILDFSKIESGKLTLHEEIFEPSSLKDTVRLLFEDVAQQNGIDLIVSYVGSENQNVLSDRSRIEQVLINLTSNAIRFTTHGSVQVRIDGALADPQNPSLKLSVTDTGTGISEEDQKKIFQPFEQGSKSAPSGRGEKGTGLGLAIVKDIIDTLGGSMDFSSELGKGTSFAIHIPVEITEKEADDSQASVEIAKISGRYLITDDLDYNLEIFREMMEVWGAEVVTAVSGSEAFEKLEEKKFDAIYLDWDLPDLSGVEIAKRIRSDERLLNQSTPIIAQTAFSTEEQKQVCFDSGMNGFLEKPITPQKLLESLKEHCPDNVEIGQVSSLNEPASQTSSTEQPDISTEYLEYLAKFGSRTLEEQLQDFMSTFDEAVQNLKNAYSALDYPSMKTFAHQLKGHLGVIQAKDHVEYFTKIDKIAAEFDESDKELLEQLMTQLPEFEDWLRHSIQLKLEESS